MTKPTGDLIGVEVLGWYDGVSHRRDKDGNKFSRIAYLPIEEDELCKCHKIYKVKQIGDFDYETLSFREDKLD